MTDNPNQIAKISLPSLVITIGTAAIIISVAAIFSYARFKSERDLINFAVTALGLSTGITSAFYVGKNIELSVDSRKTDRSLSYISGYTSPEFAEIRKSLREIGIQIDSVDKRDQPKKVREYLSGNPEIEEQVLTLLNYLEQIAVVIENGLTDEKLLKDYFVVIFERVNPKFKGCINSLKYHNEVVF